MKRTLCAAALLAVPVFAQKKLDGRAFVPLEPRAEIRVDLKTLRDTEVWDGLTRSIGGSLLPMLEQQLGFPIDAIDVLRFYPDMRDPGADDGSRELANDAGVLVLEGSAKIVAPLGAPGTRTEQMAGFEVVMADSWNAADPNCWVTPREGVLVYGAQHEIAPVLLGERHGGVTPPELLSLVAGRGIAAHVVVTLPERAGRELLETLEVGDVPAPTFFMLRLRCEDAAADAGDDGPVLHLDGGLRWADAAPQAPQQALQVLRTRLEMLKGHPRFAALKRIWSIVELGADGRDLTLHLRLGSARETGGLLGLALPFLMFTAAAPAPVQAVEVPAPAPAQPAPGDGKGDGKDGDGKDGG